MFIEIDNYVINVEQITMFVLFPSSVNICLAGDDQELDQPIIIEGESAKLLRDWINNRLDLYVICRKKQEATNG